MKPVKKKDSCPSQQTIFLGVRFDGRGGGGGKITITPCLKVVRIMVETSWHASTYFGQNRIFTQSNSVRVLLEIF